jgi:hypothetical protein
MLSELYIWNKRSVTEWRDLYSPKTKIEADSWWYVRLLATVTASGTRPKLLWILVFNSSKSFRYRWFFPLQPSRISFFSMIPLRIDSKTLNSFRQFIRYLKKPWNYRKVAINMDRTGIAQTVQWPGYGLGEQVTTVEFAAREKYFLFFAESTMALGPTEPNIYWVPGAFSLMYL